MSRKRTSEVLEVDSEVSKRDNYDDFIGIKSKNFKNLFTLDNLRRKDLKLGTLLFCIVDNVNERELTISLPGLNTAIISLENTLEEGFSVEIYDNLAKLSLTDRFAVGDIVNGAVISNNKIKNNITLKPSILNAGINSNSKCLHINGFVISGIIISKESRGYYLYTGINGIKTVFMKNEDSNYNYKIGQILPIAINKYYEDKSLLICKSIYEENDDNKISRDELLNIYEIKPGLKIECTIHSFGKTNSNEKLLNSNKKKKISDKIIQPNLNLVKLQNMDRTYINDEEWSSIQNYLKEDHSIYVSFCMGTMIGVIPNEHSIHPLSCFYTEFSNPVSKQVMKNSFSSKTLTARIIAVLSDPTNKIILSILPQNINLRKSSLNFEHLPAGTIISPLKTESNNSLKSLSSIIFHNETKDNKNNIKSINFLSYIDFETNNQSNNRWISIYSNSINKSDNIDQILKTRPCRIISRSRVENSLVVSFDPKVVQEKYFSVLDVIPGSTVQATVSAIHKWGISVRLSEYFSGRVYMEHLFNSNGHLNQFKKNLNQQQIDYLKKHYQIGRSYTFKVLRYEYSDNCWNPLLLLTSKRLLLNDKLPIINSIDETLKIGQLATGYISRISNNSHSDLNNDSQKGDYIIVRFYGEAYGSISYKEYINSLENDKIEGISKKPTIGEVLTVKIKSIDLSTKTLRLSPYLSKDQDSENDCLYQFRHQMQKLDEYNYFDSLYNDKIQSSSKVFLIAVCYEGLLFFYNKELLYVPKHSISDNKNNSSIIFDLILTTYKNSGTIKQLNKLLENIDFQLFILNNQFIKQKLDIFLVNYKNQKHSITLNLKIAYMKYSSRFIQDSNKLNDGDICWGYVTHIDHYGLLVSINKRFSNDELMVGLIPRNSVSSKIFFDCKETLENHFTINESLILKVSTINEEEKRISLSLKDVDNEYFSNSYCKIIREKFESYKRDQFLIQKLMNNEKYLKQDKNIIGKLIRFGIEKVIDNDKILAKVSLDKIKQNIFVRLSGIDKEKLLSGSKKIQGFVIGSYYLQDMDNKTELIYYVCCNEDILTKYNKIKDIKNSSCESLIKKMIENKKSIKINNENIIFNDEEFTILSINVNIDSVINNYVINSEYDKVLPVIVYTNKIKINSNEKLELNCHLIGFFDHDINSSVPILVGVTTKISENKNDSISKMNVNDRVSCKIIDHLKTYEGIVVQLKDKSYGRIHVLELDDDKVDNPLSLDKYKKGNMIECIIMNKIAKKKKFLLEFGKKKKTKYIQLIWELSSKISRIRDIVDSNESEIINDISKINKGSILSGYVSYSGKEGVFVRIGIDLTGRIKLRELTNGTITPEDASKRFYVGKFIKQMIVVNIEDNKIDLSISKLESDDIKLRLSQLKTDEDLIFSENNENNIKLNEGKEKIENINEKLSFGDLFVGRVLAGVIKSISDKHGLFINLTDLKDNSVALCKLSECLDTKCNAETISTIFNVGDNVLCKIIKLDFEDEKIWVGIKPSYFVDCNEEEQDIDMKETVDTEYESRDVEMIDLNNCEINSELNEEDLGYIDANSTNLYEETVQNDTIDDSSTLNDDLVKKVKNLNRKQKVQKQLEHEHKIRQEEEKGMKSHLNPSTVDDFERILVTHKDVSSLWIKYMSYYLDQGNLEKARLIAERSLRQISNKEEMERWNVWIAYINMEIVYGTVRLKESINNKNNEIPKNIKDIIDRALMNVYDQKKLYIQVYNSLKKYSSDDLGIILIEEALKKFPKSRKLWITYLTSLYENNNQKKARDEVIQKSLKSVSKDKVLRLITDIGRLEFEHGNITRGRTIFENLLEENMKRMDLWSQYFDILTKLCTSNINDSQYIEIARSVYKSCIEKNFKPRNMKMIFTRWLLFEKQFGSTLTQKNVQDLAIEYVNKIEASL